MMTSSVPTICVVLAVLVLSFLIGSIDFGPDRSLLTAVTNPSILFRPVALAMNASNTVTIQYCATCQTKGAAQQVGRFLAERIASDPKIVFTPYNGPPFNQIVYAILSVLQWAAIALFAFGPLPLYQSWHFERIRTAEQQRRANNPDKPPPAGLPERVQDVFVPHWLRDWQEKRWLIVGLSFLVGNMVKSFVLASKGFEVYYETNLLHSMIASGRFPTFDELIRRLTELNVPLRA